MEISESRPDNEEGKEQQGFKFTPLPDDGKLFTNFKNKDIQAKFF